MFKTVHLSKQIFSKKKLREPKILGLIAMLIIVAIFSAQQMFFQSRTDKSTKVSKNTPGVQLLSEATVLGNRAVTETTSPTNKPVQQIPSSKPVYPTQVMDLANWKLTLPTGSAGHPTEIKQPELSIYKNDPLFVVTKDNGVHFRAPVNGVTTSGSKYPRSELREMSNNGTTNASWSADSGTHTLLLDQAITAVPQTKKHVVAGQIHDAGDDIIVIRLEYPNLYVNVGGKNIYTLDSNYTLGKRFTVKFVVNSGQTKVYYNGGKDPLYVLNKNYSGAYFKTGAYTQSNCSKESVCSADNFGEVIVYQAVVTHQ